MADVGRLQWTSEIQYLRDGIPGWHRRPAIEARSSSSNEAASVTFREACGGGGTVETSEQGWPGGLEGLGRQGEERERGERGRERGERGKEVSTAATASLGAGLGLLPVRRPDGAPGGDLTG